MFRNQFLVVLIAVVLAPASADSAGLPEKVEDGVMLHCHGWPFKAIEENLDRIAAAGFNAIQVSPVQRLRLPKPNEKTPQQPTGPWWLLYQPVSFKTVGNYKLGTEADFRSLAEKAEDKSIKIIVDVVLNHVADTGTPTAHDEELDPELRDPTLYHANGSIDNYQDRWQLTQLKLGSLPDLRTQDQRVQDLQVAFLNKCIDLGADGFRFDAAKHIETSRGEDKEWAGDYWEDVLHRLKNRSKLYLFGEVLQDKGDNLDVYRTYYDVTAHNYGGVLRHAIQSRSAKVLQGHITKLEGINRNDCLAYVENHDDYEHGKSRGMQYWERKMANAFLIARAGLAPRVFDRPDDDIWVDPDLTAVNHFRNAVVGTEEFLRFPSQRLAIVERGNKAAVIINLGHDRDLDVETGLADGTYANRASAPCKLAVAGGRLRGKLPGGAVFVTFSSGDGVATTGFRAKYDVGWGHHLFIRGNTAPLTWSKGIKMRWTRGNVWTWETDAFPPGVDIEFKVLINDEKWEIVDGRPFKNHQAKGGTTTDITPVFPE